MAVTQSGYLFIHADRVCCFVTGLSEDRAFVQAKKLIEAAYKSAGEDVAVNDDDLVKVVPIVEHEGATAISWDSKSPYYGKASV